MKKNIIAISREFGSGGRTIGRLVAQKLGIQFYDRDIIKKVVEESGLTRKYVEHYGEFAPSADQRFAYSFVGLDEDSNSPLVQLWKTREKVIKDFATAKPCVIVGSCADYILSEQENHYSFFIYADDDYRASRGKTTYAGKSLKELNAEDKKRAEYYKYHTGRAWGDPKNYDCIINTSKMPLEKAADLII